VEQLDLSAIHAKYGEEKRGQAPPDPLLMTKLLVYGYFRVCPLQTGFRDARASRSVAQADAKTCRHVFV